VSAGIPRRSLASDSMGRILARCAISMLLGKDVAGVAVVSGMMGSAVLGKALMLPEARTAALIEG
jgi:hypothetical protein